MCASISLEHTTNSGTAVRYSCSHKSKCLGGRGRRTVMRSNQPGIYNKSVPG